MLDQHELITKFSKSNRFFSPRYSLREVVRLVVQAHEQVLSLARCKLQLQRNTMDTVDPICDSCHEILTYMYWGPNPVGAPNCCKQKHCWSQNDLHPPRKQNFRA